MSETQATVEGATEFSEYVAAFRRRWITIVVVAVAITAAAVGYVATAQKYWTATATVQIAPITNSPFANNANVSQLVNASNEVAVVTSDQVAAMAAKKLGKNVTPSTLTANVSVVVPPTSQILQINYLAKGAKPAADAANAFASAYLEYRAQEATQLQQATAATMQKHIDSLQSQIADADQKIATTSPTSAAHQDNLVQRDVLSRELGDLRSNQATVTSVTVNPGTLIAPATVPTAPTKPKTVLVVAGGAVAGLVLAMLVAFIRDRIDGRVREVRDLLNAGHAVIATVPGRGRRTNTLRDLDILRRRGGAAEAYRRLRAKLLARESTSHSVLVMKPQHEARPLVAANLAVAAAVAGKSVALVAADASSALDRLFDVDNSAGLTAVLAGHSSALAAVKQVSAVPTLGVLPTGPAAESASAACVDGRMREIIAELGSHYDVVVVDGPSAERASDGIAIAPAVQSVLVVANARASQRTAVNGLVDEFRQVGAADIATVLVEKTRAPRLHGEAVLPASIPTTRPGLAERGAASTAANVSISSH